MKIGDLHMNREPTPPSELEQLRLLNARQAVKIATVREDTLREVLRAMPYHLQHPDGEYDQGLRDGVGASIKAVQDLLDAETGAAETIMQRRSSADAG